MYQHDLSDKGITERLRNVVEDCVNTVGVDVNAASADLLRYVSGLNEANVREIIAFRNGSVGGGGGDGGEVSAKRKKSATASAAASASAGSVLPGYISSLADLRAIKGIGAKTFQNAAGFLRVHGGKEPLDATNIHPEDYKLARCMLEVYSRSTTSAQLSLPSAAGKVSKKAKKAYLLAEEIAKDQAPAADTLTPRSSWSSSYYWEQIVRGDGDNNSSRESICNNVSAAQLALLKTKSVAELEQIWTWLTEGAMVHSRPALAPTTTTAVVAGPYLSRPQLLRCLPPDFYAKIECGSVLNGVIRNVTTFGAFVDLGGAELSLDLAPALKDEQLQQGASKNKGIGKSSITSCDGLLHCSKYRDFLGKTSGSSGGAGGIGASSSSSINKEIYVGRAVRVKILSIEGGASGGVIKGNNGNIYSKSEKKRINLDLVELL